MMTKKLLCKLGIHAKPILLMRYCSQCEKPVRRNRCRLWVASKKKSYLMETGTCTANLTL